MRRYQPLHEHTLRSQQCLLLTLSRSPDTRCPFSTLNQYSGSSWRMMSSFSIPKNVSLANACASKKYSENRSARFSFSAHGGSCVKTSKSSKQPTCFSISASEEENKG